MHSLKQTVVAVVLLGLSFALYHISLTPSENSAKSSDVRSAAQMLGDPVPVSQISGTEISVPDFSSPSSTPDSSAHSNALLPPNAQNTSSPANPGVLPMPPLKSPADFSSMNSFDVPQTAAPTIQPGGSSSSAHQAALSIQPINSNNENSSATSNASPNEARHPVDSTMASGVQSIHYPDAPLAPGEQQPAAGDPGNPVGNDFDSRFAQREPTHEDRDQSLIQMLQTQQGIASSSEANALEGQNPSTLSGANPQPSSDPNSFAMSPDSASSGSSSNPNNTNDFAAGFGSGFESGQPTQPAMPANPIPSSTMNDSFREQAATAEFGSSSDARSGNFSAQPNLRFSQAELEQLDFKTVWPVMDQLVEVEDYRTALSLLSRFYKDQSLNGPQRQRLLGWLDALAGKVIFSAEDHLSGQPYTVQANETLTEIANRWQVPVALIANVNGGQASGNLADREIIPAGTRLKQIEGPFHAELKLSARVITLYLGDMYAGRFPVAIGTSGQPRPGVFDMVLKSEVGYVWKDVHRREYPPGSPENGYGTHWMGFSGSLCIHSVPENASEGHGGCIGLAPDDAADLFAILSQASKLTIVE
jgi:hypothetical protein